MATTVDHPAAIGSRLASRDPELTCAVRQRRAPVSEPTRRLDALDALPEIELADALATLP